jgi:hypothetical protein
LGDRSGAVRGRGDKGIICTSCVRRSTDVQKYMYNAERGVAGRHWVAAAIWVEKGERELGEGVGGRAEGKKDRSSGMTGADLSCLLLGYGRQNKRRRRCKAEEERTLFL